MKIGAIVRLIGGGPKMTVIGYTSRETLRCAWFDVDHCYNEQDFSAQVLTPVIVKPVLEHL